MRKELLEFVLSRYEITRYGQVINKKTMRVLKHADNRGYHIVSFLKDKIKFQFKVHRLVAYVHIGMPRNERLTVNHIDGNKSNNHVSNLQWCTAESNSRRFHRNNPLHALVSMPHKEQCKFSKLTQKKAEQIRAQLNQGISQTKLAKQFGVNQTTISKVGRGLIWA